LLDDALKQQKSSANKQYTKFAKGLGIVVGLLLVALIGKSLLTSPTEKPNTAEVPVSNEYSEAQNEQARGVFKRVLANFDSEFASALQSEALSRWAQDDVIQTQAAYDKAVSDFAKSNYVDALNNIEAAQKQAQTLITRWDETFNQVFVQAKEAFEQNDSRKAELYLTQALKLKPNSSDALALQQRVSKLPDIEQLLEDAQIAKTENSLEREATAISRIIQLDPARTELTGRLAQIQEQIKQSNYQQQISKGQTALNNNQLTDAQRALIQAKKLYPGRQEIKVLEQEIASKIATNRRQVWRDELKTLVTQDNWRQVLNIAQTAKKTFPTDKQFSDYEILANNILSRTQRIDRYLSQPDRLKDSGIHSSATAFVESTQSIAGNSLGLTLKLEQLNAVLDTFAEPVPITVKSDGKTNIIVVGAGRVGLTQERTIELKAGTYVFEGSRAGYRSVRVTLSVDPFAENQEITVVCHERI
jgi:hypothetical protein